MARYTPRFVLGTGAFLTMLIILLLLGGWQLKRLEWKQSLISKVTSLIPNTFISIEEIILNYKQIDEIDFYKVKSQGRFLHDLSLELIPRTYNGKNGAHLYTPFQLIPSGHIILVNRGWIPENKETVSIDKPDEEIEIQGYLQEPLLPGWLTPDNVSHNQIWYYIDLEAIQDELAKTNSKLAEKMLPFYIIAIGPEGDSIYPKPLNILSMIKNNHFGYALTWFSLAFALLIMYIIYVRKHKL